MAATGQTVTLVAGDSSVLSFVAYRGAARLDLTDASIHWQLRKYRRGPMLLEKAVGAGITITDAAQGEFAVSLDPFDTANIAVGRYPHAAKLADGTSDNATIATGLIVLRPKATTRHVDPPPAEVDEDPLTATFTPAAGPFYDPVAPGTVVGTVAVNQVDWSGVLLVDSPFAISGNEVVVGAVALSDGIYAVSGTADAVTFSGSIAVANPPVATFTPASGPFFEPLAPGTVVGSVAGSSPFVVNSPFAMSGSNVVVGASPLSAGSYTVTGTGNSAPFSGRVVVSAVIPATDLSIVITSGAVSATYSQANSTNLGDYADPDGQFIQQCFRAPRQDTLFPGLTPIFRPDLNTGRREVIVELGVHTGMPQLVMTSIVKGNPTVINVNQAHHLQSGWSVVISNLPKQNSVQVPSAANGQWPITVLSPTSFSIARDTSTEPASAFMGTIYAAYNYTAYTAEIYDGGVLQATINVPAHYWFARWRWQSAPRPVRRTAAQLIAAGLVPHYDSSRLGLGRANTLARPYNIMQFGNGTGNDLIAGMGWTGPRDDIGHMTGWQANWLCNGNANALTTVLSHGEMSGTIGMHMRDPSTGAPINALTFLGSAYPNSSTPFVYTTSGLVAYDDGHSPALCYLPALLTGDPYFIEALQFQCTMEIVSAAFPYRYTKSGRYGAWRLRNLSHVLNVTPDTIPSWMLPKSVFATYLENVRQSWLSSMASPATSLSVFRCRSYGGTQGTPGHPTLQYASMWQDAMEAGVLWMLVQFGHTEWLSIAKWKIDSEIRRADGVDYPRATPAPYSMALSYSANVASAMDATQTTMQTSAYGLGPWPALPFQVKVQNEKMLVTAMAGQTWTVVRGYAGTTAATHPAANGQGSPWIEGPMMTTWAEVGARILGVPAYLAECPVMPGDPTGRNFIYHATSGSIDYTAIFRAALAIAVRNGCVEATAAYSWIDGQFNAYVGPSWSPRWPWMIT